MCLVAACCLLHLRNCVVLEPVVWTLLLLSSSNVEASTCSSPALTCTLDCCCLLRLCHSAYSPLHNLLFLL
jgi:hypothetical protein